MSSAFLLKIDGHLRLLCVCVMPPFPGERLPFSRKILLNGH